MEGLLLIARESTGKCSSFYEQLGRARTAITPGRTGVSHSFDNFTIRQDKIKKFSKIPVQYPSIGYYCCVLLFYKRKMVRRKAGNFVADHMLLCRGGCRPDWKGAPVLSKAIRLIAQIFLGVRHRGSRNERGISDTISPEEKRDRLTELLSSSFWIFLI